MLRVECFGFRSGNLPPSSFRLSSPSLLFFFSTPPPARVFDQRSFLVPRLPPCSPLGTPNMCTPALFDALHGPLSLFPRRAFSWVDYFFVGFCYFISSEDLGVPFGCLLSGSLNLGLV